MPVYEIKVSLPENEAARLDALQRYDILDTPAEQAFDDLTLLAAHMCATPIAFLSFVDVDRQWFKSRVGLKVNEIPRDEALCAHTILRPEALVIRDTLSDERFAARPLVTSEPHIRFYAGAPLITSEGEAIGTLCVADRIPRELTLEQINALRVLSRQVVAQLELRRSLAAPAHDINEGSHLEVGQHRANEDKLQASEAEMRALFAAMTDLILVVDAEGRFLKIAPTNPALLYRPPDEVIGKTVYEVFPQAEADFFQSHVRRALTERRTIPIEYSLIIGGEEMWFAGNISPMTRSR